MKLFVKRYCYNNWVSRDRVIKDKKDLPSTVILILEFIVLLRCIFGYFYYQIEGFEWLSSLLTRIHMIYQARIRCITVTLIRHIDKI